MRQTPCKNLLTFFLVLSVSLTSVKAQDSSKASKSAPSPAIKNTPAKVMSKVQPKTNTLPKATIGQNSSLPKNTIAPPKLTDKSLNGQYEYLLKNSWMQQRYKVINPNNLTSLWRSVIDTLSLQKKQLSEANKKLQAQSKLMNVLRDQPNTSNSASSDTSVAPANSIEVLGSSIDTETYNWIMLGIIFTLAAALAAVLFVINKNGSDSKLYKQQYEETSEEYRSYKNKANEKEKKLARELQTERNTIEDLKAKREEELALRKLKK